MIQLQGRRHFVFQEFFIHLSRSRCCTCKQMFDCKLFMIHLWSKNSMMIHQIHHENSFGTFVNPTFGCHWTPAFTLLNCTARPIWFGLVKTLSNPGPTWNQLSLVTRNSSFKKKGRSPTIVIYKWSYNSVFSWPKTPTYGFSCFFFVELTPENKYCRVFWPHLNGFQAGKVGHPPQPSTALPGHSPRAS